MPNYVLAYHGGGKPDTREEGEKMMAAWNKWVEDLGDQMVEPGNPVGKSYTVSASGVEDHGGANPLMGYSVVKADNIEAALEIAKGCAHLLMKNATIEVAEQMQM